MTQHQTTQKPKMTPVPMTAKERTRLNAQRLRVLLACAVAKEEAGQALTVTEENLLAELYRRKHEKRRERITVDADGTVRVNTVVDAEPIMEAVKAYGDFIDRHTQRKQAQRYVGSLDPVTAYNWMKETGLKIGTKEFAQFAMKRIKHDIDYRAFRLGG